MDAMTTALLIVWVAAAALSCFVIRANTASIKRTTANEIAQNTAPLLQTIRELREANAKLQNKGQRLAEAEAALRQAQKWASAEVELQMEDTPRTLARKIAKKCRKSRQ